MASWPAYTGGCRNDKADVYPDSLRCGGAVVSARVSDADAPSLQAGFQRFACQIEMPFIERGGKSLRVGTAPKMQDVLKGNGQPRCP